MSGIFDEFLSKVVSDCVNGRSGDMAAYAAGVREAAKDVAEGRGPWLGVEYRCPECERRVLSLQHDGRCDSCAGIVDEEGEARRRAEAVKVAHRQASDLLLRMANDRGLNSTFRAVLLEEAEILRRRAS